LRDKRGVVKEREGLKHKKEVRYPQLESRRANNKFARAAIPQTACMEEKIQGRGGICAPRAVVAVKNIKQSKVKATRGT